MTLPPRLLGYGAYSLANDKYLGKPAGGAGPIFFKYLRDGGWPVNLVKVICFRFSGQDGLDPARRLSLYDPQRQINTAFLDNLSNTVDQARQFGFWVQVCLFSYQSVAETEQPENAPTVFKLDNPGTPVRDPRQNVRDFFNADDPARFGEQIRLVRAIADRLRVYPNVLWELANELRMGNYIPSTNDSTNDNCQLVTWLNRVRAELVRALQGTPALITTSTGTESQDERFFFSRRPTDNCASPPLPVEFFDFHSGQWDIGPDVNASIVAAKKRAASYNPSAFLIINDDGLHGASSPASLLQWATTAYANGLHYAAKQTYPPAQPWNIDALNALKQAFYVK